MHRDEAERALSGLRAGQGRIASAMFTIDSHPALGFLRAGGNRGRTQAAWDGLRGEVDTLWTEFNTLNELLDSTSVMSTRRLTDAEVATVQRATALAATLEPRCSAAITNLDAVNAAWNACGAAVAPVTDALTGLSRLANELGATASVGPLNQHCSALRDTLLADPLTAAPGGALADAYRSELQRLTDDVGAALRAMKTQATLRDSFPERVAALQAQIDAVRAEEARTHGSFQRAAEKISDTQLPPVPAAADVLRARVFDLDKARARKQWNRLTDDVAALESAIARAQSRAAELREAADGLIARRDELRGRLDAYRAKAARHKIDENDELATLHSSAHTLLYTAPCDLPEATRAVYAYQKAVTTATASIPEQTGRKETR